MIPVSYRLALKKYSWSLGSTSPKHICTDVLLKPAKSNHLPDGKQHTAASAINFKARQILSDASELRLLTTVSTRLIALKISSPSCSVQFF